MGIILGGAIVERCAGGYEGKHSLIYCFVFSGLAFICTIPVKYASGVYSFGIILWGVLFFGGAVIPNLQGVMISSLKKHLRASGNSISNIFQNLLGFLPAPFLYGLIYQHTKDSDPKLAMALTLWYSLAGFSLIGLAMVLRYKYVS